MIISKSNVGMSSSREYSKKMWNQHTTAQRNRATGARTFTSVKFALDFSQREYHQSHYGFQDMGNQTNNYGSSGLLLGESLFDQTEKLMPDMQKSENSEFVKSKDNISDINKRFDEVTTNLYRSLLDLLKNLRFRGMFNDSEYYNSISQNNYTEDTLALTNADNATTWDVYHESLYHMEESECTTFSTTGTAITADGRHLQFDLNLQMSRTFMQESKTAYATQYQKILTDPLVINLSSNPTSVTGKTFMFDLDHDGKEEEVSVMDASSGFLALDKNKDGVINDGSELFGTRTGNGFYELSEYDSDGNGWIDEADEIYSKLKVWVKDENGKDRLMSLKDADVGAIYLGSSQTDFSLKDDDNNLLGRVRSTGMYFHEDGTAGTIQQVDF